MWNKITNTIALDRGYQTEDLINQLNEWGCKLIGTLKQCKFAPFAFGEGSRVYQHQLVLDKKGPRVDLFMTQTHQNSRGQVVRSVAGLHRTGLGKCFMTHSTDAEYGPLKYTVTLKTGQYIDTRWPPAFAQMLQQVIPLTCDQRSPTWFLLREFVFSSTSCYTCLRIKAKNISLDGPHATPPAHIAVLDTLGITRHTASLGDCDIDVEQVVDVSNETVESLLQLTRPQLVLLCQQRRLPYSGNKQQIAERLLAHELSSRDPGDLIGDLLKCWFLEPVRSESMKIGSNNENLVLAALPSFFTQTVPVWALDNQKTSLFEWQDAIQIGLVCLRNKPYMATSVDQLVRVVLKQIPPLAFTMPRQHMEMIPAESSACQFHECSSVATYGNGTGSPSTYCAVHKSEGTVEMRLLNASTSESLCAFCISTMTHLLSLV
jgi:hypothetical protein